MTSASCGPTPWATSSGATPTATASRTSGEPGLAGATVTLYTSTGTQVGTPQTTTSSGAYLFSNLGPGQYKVCFTTPSGYSYSPALQGGDTATDSDANAGTPTGCSAVFTLTSNQNITTIDAGMYRPASVGDFVWSDTNANGVQDSGASPAWRVPP